MQDHNGSNPYEGPKAELEDQPAYRSHATFRDSTGLTKWTKRFLYAQIVVAVMAIVSSALEYALLSDFATGAYSSQKRAIADGEASDARQSLVGIAQVLVLLISGFLILRWIYIANFNARQLGAAGMVFSPGWSVGWYFIPFANLWKPYQAMKEIWLASSNPQSWKNQPVAPLLRWWWFFWIVSSLLGNAPFRVAMRAEGLDELMTANLITQMSDLAGIPLSIIVLVMVTRVHQMQMSQLDSTT